MFKQCVCILVILVDVIMSAMASQITSLTIVSSTVNSRRRSKKTSKLGVTVLWAGNSPVTGEFPAQRTSNAEDFSIWWRHHDIFEWSGARFVWTNYYWGPVYQHKLILIRTCIRNYIHRFVWYVTVYMGCFPWLWQVHSHLQEINIHFWKLHAC